MLESSVHGTCVCKQYSTNTKGKINKLLTLLWVSANSLLNLLVSVHRLDRRSLVSSRISSNLYTCKFCGFDARAANQGAHSHKAKSAYSIPTKKGKLDTHIFVVWVDNEAGVLARVVGLFSGRGYNIESLAVAEIDQTKNISRITIVTTGTPQVIDQIKLQLKKLVPVHKVADFKREDKKVIFKEMALLKIVGNKKKIR